MASGINYPLELGLSTLARGHFFKDAFGREIMSKYICPIAVRIAFSYNPCTGEFKKIKGRIREGKTGYKHICGPKNCKKEYVKVGFCSDYFYAHRLIWVWMTGKQPEDIDHIDGNGLNNKWDNLRSVAHRINGKNQKRHVTNTSGTGGVTYRKDTNKWRARIMVDDKSINLGSFESKEDAIAVRLAAEYEHGFITGE